MVGPSPGQSKIRYTKLTISSDEKISWFQIPMENSALVHGLTTRQVSTADRQRMIATDLDTEKQLFHQALVMRFAETLFTLDYLQHESKGQGRVTADEHV